MTIFDVIRYPISIPPTEEELEAVPKIIFNKWRDDIGLHSKFQPSDFVRWYNNGMDNVYVNEITQLKQMIADYDDL